LSNKPKFCENQCGGSHALIEDVL